MIRRRITQSWTDDHRVTIKENEKREMYLDLARELRKLLKMWTVIPIVKLSARNGLQSSDKGAGRVGNRRTNKYYPNNRMVEIGLNT